jgi:hypothetical protein
MELVKSIKENHQKTPQTKNNRGENYGPTGSQLEWMRRNNRNYIDFGQSWTFGPRDFEY